MDKSLHTVTLDKDKCKGCISCMRRCPTEAIRVRNGKAKVIYEQCIGCGECVRVCPHYAKVPAFDPFDSINNYKYRVAVPAPSLYAQFKNMEDIDLILNGLLEIGFNDIVEVAAGAELVTEATKMILESGEIAKPVLSTACPAILELILLRYPNLKGHLLPIKSPADIAIDLAWRQALDKGIPKEDIGVFFISPCPAKVFALKEGIVVDTPKISAVLSISEVYFRLVNAINILKRPRKLQETGALGVSWAASGGEAIGLNKEKYLAASGVENIKSVLQQIENGKLDYIDFIELNSCVGGCVGGVLTVENPFVAHARLREIQKYMRPRGITNTINKRDLNLSDFRWEKEPIIQNSNFLGDDRIAALEKLEMIDKVYESLPHIDCGTCGAPSCRAFAEDVVLQYASLEECDRRDTGEK